MPIHKPTRTKLYDAFLRDSPVPVPIPANTLERRTGRSVLAELGSGNGNEAWLQVRGNTWALGPAAGHVLVFDCSWRRMTAALFDPHGVVLRQHVEPIRLMPRRGPSCGVGTVRAAARKLLGLVVGPPRPTIVGAAVVWPAPIPRHSDRVVRSGLSGAHWAKADLREIFAQEFARGIPGTTVPIAFYNDANAEALGEAHYGVGRGASNILLVKICEGIGASLIVDGEIYEGARGKAGEIGHIVPRVSRVDTTGLSRARARLLKARACSCGAFDHLESWASGRAIVSQLFPRDDTSSYEQCISKIKPQRDDFDLHSTLDRAGTIVGEALGPLVQMLDPDRIIISAEPDDPALFDGIIVSLLKGARIPGENIVRPTLLTHQDPTMSLRGAAHCAIREYVIPRLRAGILLENHVSATS